MPDIADLAQGQIENGIARFEAKQALAAARRAAIPVPASRDCVCGEPIPAARLRACPETRHCPDCATDLAERERIRAVTRAGGV